jgi:hypothetical protein
MITFDFDSTLTKPSQDDDGIWWDTLNPNQNMIERIKDFALKGRTIKIVTSRADSQLFEVSEFVKKHDLPISAIHATNGDDKVNTLRELGSTLHFDDDAHEIKQIKESLPSCKTCHVSTPNGRFF